MAQSPVSAVSMLCAALEHGSAADWPCDAHAADGMEALLEARLIVELPLAKHLACPYCYEIAEVHHENNGTIRLRCEDRTLLNRNWLRRWRVDRAALADFLKANLSLSGAVEERIDGRFWLLGRMAGRGDGFPLWLLVGSDDAGVRLSCLRMLEQRGPAEQGVLISSSSSALSTVWPRDTQAVVLEDILSISRAGGA